MGNLHSKITNGEYSIEIKETRVGRLAALNKGGERTLTETEHKELQELLSEYQDIILKLWDAYNEEDDKYLSTWRMGKIYKEEVREDEHREMDILTPLLPFVDSKENRASYLYQRFYEVFPDKKWDKKDAPMTIAELAQKVGPEEARRIYDENIRDANTSITRDEIRAWDDIQKETDDPTLEQLVEKAVGRVRNPDAKNIKNIYRLLGRNDFPSDQKIAAALQEAQ
ncbi:hypothetical protein E6P09_02930 [Haloferax mediterranei ATCC 33500]|uniref:Uncharacterized protein n=2 Tax=Haloferacaceae TaxID=1644056 RepID=I3R8V3_HALMT|nr:hypothetical protein HFX_2999 [Haloferax mediterranei ATCC 33500]AHZ22853.1 hypothetical protein BM92_09470 [Haloferax mediterranei ATCC 33500]EMA03017.1 hypothetical protein C439_10550 [Haloferax mediterranei ATCC 33500]QCQ76568.1 hypothetical protein E6P09_02930 [Haloferax mediterranei ATCC 33500]